MKNSIAKISLSTILFLTPIAFAQEDNSAPFSIERKINGKIVTFVLRFQGKERDYDGDGIDDQRLLYESTKKCENCANYMEVRRKGKGKGIFSKKYVILNYYKTLPPGFGGISAYLDNLESLREFN